MSHGLRTLTLACLVLLACGWSLGYQSVADLGVFWVFSTLVGWTALRIAHRVFPSTDGAATLIRVAVLSFGLIVFSGLALGSVGLLSIGPYLVFLAVLCSASLFLRAPRGPLPTFEAQPVPLSVAALVVPVFVLIVCVGLAHPPQAYDSLNYHLYFPASWLQDHRLSIVPTPFGDEAPAYAPANGELLFLWLMVPFHGDLVARIGQLPAYLLAGLTVYALARVAGAKPQHAIYAPALFLLAKPVVEQAAGANVDLIFAAMFLVSLYLGLVAIETNERRDWWLWGVALGLYWGCKYATLVYTPVFLLLPFARGPRIKALWALPGIAAFALPWYGRNWLVAGSPIYPATLRIAGVTVAQGAFTRAAMLSSPFHVDALRLLPIVVACAFGLTLVAVWVPLGILGGMSILRRWRAWPIPMLMLTPVLMIALFWFGIPENIEPRFLFPVVGLAMVLVPFAFRSNPTWNAGIHGLLAVGMVWMLVGANAHLTAPFALPWFMADWLTFPGVVTRQYGLVFVGLALAGAGVWFAARRIGRVRVGTVALTGIACAIVGVGAERRCPPAGCDFLQIAPNFVRPTMLDGWDWIGQHTDHATIAYTGNNIPYPLFGARLTNRVYYVNIDAHTDWRFHDYARAEARRPGFALPNTSRPRYERLHGDMAAWLQNLTHLGVNYLFVSALSTYEDSLWQDAEGFPIEDAWASSAPQTFQLVYQNRDVKIYAVRIH